MPALRPIRGGRVAVSIVVNFEEGAEFSINDGDCENEAVCEIEQRLAGRPDPAIDSHFEYGSRARWWRIMEVLGQHGAPATVSSSGRAAVRNVLRVRMMPSATSPPSATPFGNTADRYIGTSRCRGAYHNSKLWMRIVSPWMPGRLAAAHTRVAPG